MGLNSHRAVDNTSNATITVQVQGICGLLHIQLYAAAFTILSDQKIKLFKEAYHSELVVQVLSCVYCFETVFIQWSHLLNFCTTTAI